MGHRGVYPLGLNEPAGACANALLVKRLLILLLVLGLVARAEAPSTLQVFAAASLTDAFGTLGKQFEATHPGVRVVLNFAGSQQLIQQLAQGAQADVLATADSSQMAAAVREGVVLRGTDRIFARNRLIVVTPPDNPAGVRKLEDLARPGLKLILADKNVPVGGYTLQMLERVGGGFSGKVLANVVSYEQNVRAVLTKVALGEADAGIVYVTDARAQKVLSVKIPDPYNPVAVYPIAATAHPARAALASEFVQYVRSPPAQKALVDNGFLPGRGLPLALSGKLKATVLYADRYPRPVGLVALLQRSGVRPGVKHLVLVGADNDRKTISWAALQKDRKAVLQVGPFGEFRVVIPSLAPDNWVKDLILIEAR